MIDSGGALDRLRELVAMESPSGDETRLRAIADYVARTLERLGATLQVTDVPGVGVHLLGRFAGAEPDRPPLLLLGHLDTVHPVGTFDPVFQVVDGRAMGPGVFDMKGGWACALEALSRSIHGPGLCRSVWVLATCDEETGSKTSRELIEEVGRKAHAVLVPEPPFADGGAKTSRKGVAWYRMEIRGRASHAGLAPEDGVNAVEELAHQVLAASALEDRSAGTTVTVTETGGGTASNVVPAAAWASLDVRFTTAPEARRVDAALRSMAPVLDGADIRLSGGINRPPMERTPDVATLYDVARALAEEDGWELGEGRSGGASDGSLTAGLGIPTLDGIGPRGGGAHARTEHVLVEDLERRVALFQGLLTTL